jgi:hypothetical protein
MKRAMALASLLRQLVSAWRTGVQWLLWFSDNRHVPAEAPVAVGVREEAQAAEAPVWALAVVQVWVPAVAVLAWALAAVLVWVPAVALA